MNLQKLLVGIDINEQTYDQVKGLTVKGITDNSKKVKEGYLFVAIKGLNFDGHRGIDEALENGAIGVIGEYDINDLKKPYIKVNNSRKVLGIIGKNFYRDPSKNKVVIGVTGTNGKTTVSYLLRFLLEQHGMSCGLIGTIKNTINGVDTASINTTPSSLVMNELLSKSNDDVVILEVSSHGLTQYRLEGIEFDYCIFTNLTQDHLDYHGSMENYFLAKKMLFEKMKENGVAIINIDDIWGEKLEEILIRKKLNVYSVGQSSQACLRIAQINSNINPDIKVRGNCGEFDISFSMEGTHNLYNAVIAFATVNQFIFKVEDTLGAILNFPGVPGRFEKIKYRNGSTVVIDYAHTADAIFFCLNTAKELGAKKVTHVFGFRGNRDEKKRNEMLRISSEMSDRYILTHDDLNTIQYEEMCQTLNELNKQFGNEKGFIVNDRTLAIKHALDSSSENEWVVITGKGHESYQQDYITPTTCDRETVMHFNSYL
ncbi:UDP-N-acetylmuramoyl-L-alanyl-D-glutamate--2,6-diaminopimelate ligase [Metabacillus halosaccharovorans]|uniref:UDP-N-acetylmuramoyl-L-alanyl-D-glutamate--2, 6-diaminopimelate ligase n=1 Tax=Metabacillus halosaccharovorans TaxID=930124 RepID=UPI00403D806E